MTRIQSAFNLLKRVGFAVLFFGGMVMRALFMLVILAWAIASAQPPQILWERDGEGDSSRYGREILPLGDQNLDGFDDFAVQAFGVGPQGTDEGVWLDFFLGGNPPSTEPYMRIQTPPDGIWTGDVWTLDFNGDDFTDIMLTGNVKIYFGGPEIDTIPDIHWPNQRRDTETTKQPLGDFNGDGNDDFFRHDGIIGGGDTTEFFWGGMPFDTLPDMVLHSPPNRIGKAAPATHGDLNGDGIEDFITAVYFGGTLLYVYFGSTEPDTLADQEIITTGTYVHVDIVPDLNGDGKDDLILFGDHEEWPGDYFVFLGGDTLSSTPEFGLESGCVFPLDEARNYGPEISGAGDYNNDGINDLLIVSPNCPNWGVGSLYLGYHWLNADPVWTIRGRDAPYDLIGIRFAAGVGDINNDGFDDVAFGAFKTTDFDGWRGRAIVIAGRAMQVSTENVPLEVPSDLEVSIYPNPFNSNTTLMFALPLASNVNITIHDVLGRNIEQHALGRLTAGQYEVSIRSNDWPSGVYVYHIKTPNFQDAKKMILIR